MGSKFYIPAAIAVSGNVDLKSITKIVSQATNGKVNEQNIQEISDKALATLGSGVEKFDLKQMFGRITGKTIDPVSGTSAPYASASVASAPVASPTSGTSAPSASAPSASAPSASAAVAANAAASAAASAASAAASAAASVAASAAAVPQPQITTPR
jgi:hypothetical protein